MCNSGWNFNALFFQLLLLVFLILLVSCISSTCSHQEVQGTQTQHCPDWSSVELPLTWKRRPQLLRRGKKAGRGQSCSEPASPSMARDTPQASVLLQRLSWLIPITTSQKSQFQALLFQTSASCSTALRAVWVKDAKGPSSLANQLKKPTPKPFWVVAGTFTAASLMHQHGWGFTASPQARDNTQTGPGQAPTEDNKRFNHCTQVCKCK